MKLSHVLIVAGGLAVAGTASFAATGEETLGQRLADGSITQQEFQQLIQFTGLTPEQAKQETLQQIIAKRWQQN